MAARASEGGFRTRTLGLSGASSLPARRRRRCAEFSPDGRWILCALRREVGPHLVGWPLDPVAIAQSRKPRDLTDDERERFGIAASASR